jgi:hypothetical protein
MPITASGKFTNLTVAFAALKAGAFLLRGATPLLIN